MKIFLVTFVVLLFVMLASAADNSTPKPAAAGSPVDRWDCNSPTKNVPCSIKETKRVYYDAKAKECKLLEKNTCAGNALNQFTTISSCKYKCILDPARKAGSTTPKA